MTVKADQGSYYALKGYLYQFDKTLIEVLTHRHTHVNFENLQDIDYEDFVLQIKHKETQTYAPQKVGKAIEGLLDLFSQDTSKRFCLYCHFSDQQPRDHWLTLSDLDSLIREDAMKRHPVHVREQFLHGFVIRFSEDYESQFSKTVSLIMASFGLPERESAVLYHSIFRSKLLDLCLLPKPQRKIQFADLKAFLENAEVRVFTDAYARYAGAEKYVRMIKKAFFTTKLPNIENFQRLFLVECDQSVSTSDLIKLAAIVSNKFYRKGKSPQPYIVFRNLANTQVNKLKQELLDHRVQFFDGTHFDGDRFRMEDLVGEPANGRTYSLKLVFENEVSRLIQEVKMNEIFQFFLNSPLVLNVFTGHRRIQIEKTDQILRMLA